MYPLGKILEASLVQQGRQVLPLRIYEGEKEKRELIIK